MAAIVFLALHLVYGAGCAFAAERRMRAEGEVLGWPLVVTFVPVALVSAPVGALLSRYAASWFLGALVPTSWAIEYERFHLGILIAVGVACALATVVGNFAAIAFLSRDMRRAALAPIALAALMALLALALGAERLLYVEEGVLVLTHAAFVVTLGAVLALAAGWAFIRARLSEPALVHS